MNEYKTMLIDNREKISKANKTIKELEKEKKELKENIPYLKNVIKLKKERKKKDVFF